MKLYSEYFTDIFLYEILYEYNDYNYEPNSTEDLERDKLRRAQ